VSPVFNIPHKQTEPSMSQADPYYVMLSTMSNDAICISVISVMGQKIQGTFFGDTGYMCGMSWFPSDNAIGSDYSKPRCAWLDADHSAQINARAVSFHLNDMQPEPQKLAQYDENQDTLCKSSPRFSFWGNLLPDGVPPFFNPPLKYTGDNGADVDITKVLDDPENPVESSYADAVRQTPDARNREAPITIPLDSSYLTRTTTSGRSASIRTRTVGTLFLPSKASFAAWSTSSCIRCAPRASPTSASILM
jgi:hypothetical protein